MFEVGDEGGDWLVDGAGVLFVAVFDVAVLVPAVAVAAGGGEFDEADAAFDEAAGEQALGAEFAGVWPLGFDAVQCAWWRRFRR